MFLKPLLVPTWNSLPEEIMTTKAINSFRERLHKFDLTLIDFSNSYFTFYPFCIYFSISTPGRIFTSKVWEYNNNIFFACHRCCSTEQLWSSELESVATTPHTRRHVEYIDMCGRHLRYYTILPNAFD